MASFGRGKMIAEYSGPDTAGRRRALEATHDAALEEDAVPEDVEVDYVPGWWGGYYFVGDYMQPLIQIGANGHDTCRVNGAVAAEIVVLDMVHIHRACDTRVLI